MSRETTIKVLKTEADAISGLIDRVGAAFERAQKLIPEAENQASLQGKSPQHFQVLECRRFFYILSRAHTAI